MNSISNALLGKAVIYYDYVGDERYGKIIAIEPYSTDSDLAWIYISDNEDIYNIHEDVVNENLIKYAAIKLSDEIYLDEEE